MNNNIFKSPSNEYRIKPFWFLNGDLNYDEIKKQLHEMADKGIGGVFICARQGMEVPYLSKKWFQTIGQAIEIANNCNLEVWLYDEYPYPSGMSGGEVTLRHPEAKARLLDKSLENSKGYYEKDLPWANILCALAVPTGKQGEYLWDEAIDIKDCIGSIQATEVFQQTGLTSYTDKRYFTYGPIKRIIFEPDNKDMTYGIYILAEKELSDFKYYGTYVDPCNEDAMNTFIETTYQRYKDEFAQYFGKEIKGMFSDETGLSQGFLPYTNQIAKEFKERSGYDLLEHLPAFIDKSYKNCAKIRYDYYRNTHLLFQKVYHKKISKWCDDNKISFATEVPAFRMSTQRYNHIPGGDTAHEKIGKPLDDILTGNFTSTRANEKMISSLARQLGRKFAMIESFHSIGWSMTLQDAKLMFDRMAAFSINFFNVHAFYYTTDAMKKHDAPPSQFLQNPYWPHYKTLADYVGRLSCFITESNSTTNIAYLTPISTYWSHLCNPFHHFHYEGSDMLEKEKIEKISNDFVSIGKELIYNQIEYDHLDGEILADATICGKSIVIGHAKYEILILPPQTNIENFAWKKIKEFIRAGGKVIALGMLPYEIIDENQFIEQEASEIFLTKDSFESYFNNNYPSQPIKINDNVTFIYRNPDYINNLVDLLNEINPNKINFNFMSGNRKSFLTVIREESDGSSLVFITNQENGCGEIMLHINASQYYIENLCLETGNITNYDSNTISFKPFESKLFRVKYASIKEQPKNLIEDLKIKIDASKEWKVTPSRENAFRLAEFELKINNEYMGKVTPRPIINQCMALGEEHKYPVSFSQTFGIPVKMHMNYPIHLSYNANFFAEEIPQTVKILMDNGAISGCFQILINGNKITYHDFRKEWFYDQNNITCDISSYVVNGENSIEILVEALKDWDGLIDPIYLIGNFGVMENKIVKTISKAKLRSKYISGFPYFAGELTFETNFSIDNKINSPYFTLCFENWDDEIFDIIEIYVNDNFVAKRTWAPYEFSHLNSSVLKPGNNTLKIKLTNTLIGLLDGKYFDFQTNKICDIKLN